MKSARKSRKNVHAKTRFNRKVPEQGTDHFKNEIVIRFFQILMTIKLFHWKTTNFSLHTATDNLYTILNTNMDLFIETLLGKSANRINLTRVKHISLVDLENKEELKREVEQFKSFLLHMDENRFMMKDQNSDLLTIRDDILMEINKFLYLLTLN
jgi:DNA-binding ferritin-like protein